MIDTVAAMREAIKRWSGRAAPIVIVALPVVGTIFTTLGQNHKNTADWAWLIGGALLIVVAGGLQLWREVIRHKREAAELSEAVRLRVAMKDALQPIAELIASMPTMTKAGRRARRNEVCTQAVGALCLLLKDVDRLRSVVYAVDDDGQSMSVVAYQGRGSTPRPFAAGETRGDLALKLVREAKHVFVPDLDAQSPADYSGTRSDYRTFISASISVGSDAYGMLTVDAPHADDLVDTDCQIVLLVADLLAIAFAEADRPS